ncbi:hypothetical protein ASPVEDRAFT_82717 [Aspergillus versicolor CBS 583.65]|uniref:CSD domain-containing protein n=1 Tax=Aspergillus versicolor CBS 583.65 TaxID=1036611 RepID=A0A1L9PI18_ASPVE|nr:uncharacterized protein ASPVEDRAFT_82717 [Aspergillus versicolor CBS 583.65]OJJ01180.1 hypothetical protein ASPVEDRAFT_82717 [Aspergillus versicolor CBS 583.65]
MSTATLPVLTKTPFSQSHTMSNRQYGTVKWYNDEQGFGFITSDFGGELILRHQSIADASSLKEGMKVSYEAIQGPILLMADQVQLEE